MAIADTGFWVALASIRDKHHEAAKYQFIELSEQDKSFITTSIVPTLCVGMSPWTLCVPASLTKQT